jgi:hypothetical protein
MAEHGLIALVFDPGKVTGYGFLRWVPGDKSSAGFQGAELDHHSFLQNAEEWIAGGSLSRVVGEGYKVTARTVEQDSSSVTGLWSVKQLGAVEHWCWRAGVPFEQQMPSAKSFDASGDKLRRVGWWAPGPGRVGERGHRRDAARHALKWAVDHRVVDPGVLLP